MWSARANNEPKSVAKRSHSDPNTETQTHWSTPNLPRCFHRPWTTWSPLALVLGVSLLKEGIEDYSRHKADKETNKRIVQVLSPHSQKFEPCTWQKVRTCTQGQAVGLVCMQQGLACDSMYRTGIWQSLILVWEFDIGCSLSGCKQVQYCGCMQTHVVQTC